MSDPPTSPVAAMSLATVSGLSNLIRVVARRELLGRPGIYDIVVRSLAVIMAGVAIPGVSGGATAAIEPDPIYVEVSELCPVRMWQMIALVGVVPLRRLSYVGLLFLAAAATLVYAELLLIDCRMFYVPVHVVVLHMCRAILAVLVPMVLMCDGVPGAAQAALIDVRVEPLLGLRVYRWHLHPRLVPAEPLAQPRMLYEMLVTPIYELLLAWWLMQMFVYGQVLLTFAQLML